MYSYLQNVNNTIFPAFALVFEKWKSIGQSIMHGFLLGSQNCLIWTFWKNAHNLCESVCKLLSARAYGQCLLKVSKSRKQFMVSSILPKNEKNRPNSTTIPQVDFFCSFFGRNEGTLNCFRDLLTFKARTNQEGSNIC